VNGFEHASTDEQQPAAERSKPRIFVTTITASEQSRL
jgi:hypothetical protein